MQRSFKQAVQYQEGRKVRNTRNARAMQKNSKFGRKQQEESWQTAEVEALFRLANAGVRVPQPYICIDGVLLMELVTDAEGAVAPRLSDVILTEESAIADFNTMIRNIVRMLCAGIVHGDLSEFNVLLDAQGPVIIDLPQAVDAAGNNLAESMFARDVNNITAYYGQFAPQLLQTRYAQEIWMLYEDGKLTPETVLTGLFVEAAHEVDMDSLIDEIIAAEDEFYERQRARKERDDE
ncbi:serine protein kinase RIO [Pectobacterium araliae]|uniref:non-specific serine/threonine protein kinase n=2 Tax=Pectobacterium araliae TaxID=3073862 RepID=A0AAN0KBM0_9GAMM|nr:serine protein kinase RIO [Pectobacterium sp. MAFF 302110]